jgi:putative hydrolase of the HAD superfamily
MLRAALFDWGDTLMRFDFDEALVAAGHRAGLEALDRGGLPDSDAFTARFRERYQPLFFVPGEVDEIDYPGMVRSCFSDLGAELMDVDVECFLEAEHDAWKPARYLPEATFSMLDGLRELGLSIGLVSNAFDPPSLLHRDLEAMGVATRLDVAVFSSEVGKRKPDPAIFEQALGALGVTAAEALFVGDRLYEDVHGAGQLGMTTVQALWFREDEHAQGGEPDFRALTPDDVLDVARRLV